MRCKDCGEKSRVLDSREALDGKATYRRRVCKNGHRWTTFEVEIEEVKKSNRNDAMPPRYNDGEGVDREML